MARFSRGFKLPINSFDVPLTIPRARTQNTIQVDGKKQYRRPDFCTSFSDDNYVRLYDGLRQGKLQITSPSSFSHFANRWILFLGYATCFLIFLFEPEKIWTNKAGLQWRKTDLEYELLKALRIDVELQEMDEDLVMNTAAMTKYKAQVQAKKDNVRECLRQMLEAIMVVVANHPAESGYNGPWQTVRLPLLPKLLIGSPMSQH
jgi:hypothetical protein